MQEHGDAVDADGYFGPATQAAVRGFQEMQGLSATGEIDSVTWQVLTGGRLQGVDANANGIVDSWEVTAYIPGLPHWG